MINGREMDPAWSSRAAYSTEPDLALSTAQKARRRGAGMGGGCLETLISSQTQRVSFAVACGFHKTHRPFSQDLIRGHRFGPLSLAPKLVINQEAGLGAAADTGNSARAVLCATRLGAQGLRTPKSSLDLTSFNTQPQKG